jgi:Zn-dependent membrane protease YugP
MFFLSPLWLILVGPTLLFALWAQMKVKSAFAKYSQIGTASGLSGAEAAAAVLQTQGIPVEIGASEGNPSIPHAVAIARTQGFLSDHYDPRTRVLRLSPNVYEGRSLASVGVACHEAGHALQHAGGYAPLAIRSNLVPFASFGSWAAFPIILLGLMIGKLPLAMVGLAVFAAIVAFQIVTLPVEFNASKRAKKALYEMGIIRGRDEQQGVAAVLDAAALTYVAAAVSAVATLLYYFLLVTGGGRRA